MGSKIANGYKQTEVGVIPDDWEVEILGEYCTKIGSGITPTGGEKIYQTKGRPFIRSQNVAWGSLDLSDVAFIDDEIHSTFKTTEIKADDVFLNITGASIGRSAMADERVAGGNVNQHVCIIRLEQKYLSPRYINYFLLSKPGQKQIDSFQSGGNRQGLNLGQIKKFVFPFPSNKEEQSAIATVLTDTDNLINSLEKLIAKKEAIKKATMQALLTGKKRLPRFSGKWGEVELGNLVNILKGNALSKSKVSDAGAFKCILYGELFTTYGRVIRKIASYTNYNEGVSSKTGDILLPGSTTTVGIDLAIASTVCENNILLGGDINILRRKSADYNSEFLAYYLTYVKTKEIAEKSQGTTIIHLYGKSLKDIQLRIPKVEEQEIIAKVIEDMESEIFHLQEKLEKSKSLKQGLMQQLLTGKIRLV